MDSSNGGLLESAKITLELSLCVGDGFELVYVRTYVLRRYWAVGITFMFSVTLR